MCVVLVYLYANRKIEGKPVLLIALLLLFYYILLDRTIITIPCHNVWAYRLRRPQNTETEDKTKSRCIPDRSSVRLLLTLRRRRLL